MGSMGSMINRQHNAKHHDKYYIQKQLSHPFEVCRQLQHTAPRRVHLLNDRIPKLLPHKPKWNEVGKLHIQRQRTKITGIIIQKMRERKWSCVLDRTRQHLAIRPMGSTYHQLKTAREGNTTGDKANRIDGG